MKTAACALFLACSLFGLSAQSRGLSVVARQVTENSNFDVGKQYAVIIGIDSYQNWNPLKGAVAEAQSLKKVLADDYYIDEFIELYNDDATASNIRKLFSQTLPSKLDVHDSLLIFYAGHGHLDESKSGFWIPVDGGTDTLTQDRWIPNAQLRNYIGQLKAQRILVMADSCFSGDLLNTNRGAIPNIDSAYYKQALQLTSRQVLSSGSSETVPDNSEFAQELIGYLERNTEPMVDSLSIYERIRKGMTQTLPLFGSLPGNENGASFVLFSKKNSLQAEVPQSEASEKVSPSMQSATLHIKAGSDFHAWALPADNLKATPIVVSEGTKLPIGNWVVKAQLPDDVVATWSQDLALPVAAEVDLTIPSLSHSIAFQTNALDAQRALLMPTVAKEETKYQAQKAWGWVSLVAGVAGMAVMGYGYYDGKAAYTQYSSDIGSAVASDRSRLTLDTTLLWSGLGLGGVGISASPFLFLINPASADSAKVHQLDAQITQLKSENTADEK